MLLLCFIPLLWAAFMDWKKRLIPDWTWFSIILIGGVSAFLFPEPALPERIAGFLLPGACLLFLAMKYDGVGGGDVKLTAALGFCFGLNALAAIFFFALFPALVYGLVTRQRSVPLAVFLCIGFCIYAGVLFIYGLTC
jgi:leader peptidase (prepilin peptidase)/N-methyltransferase